MSGRVDDACAARRRWWSLAALLLALLAGHVLSASAQSDPLGPTPVLPDEAGALPPSMPPGMRLEPRDAPLPEYGMIDVWVELRGPSAADVRAWALRWGLPSVIADELAALQGRRLRAAQEALIPLLTAPPIEARVVGGAQGVLNGLAIQVDARQIEAVRQLPGVAGVHRLRLGTLNGPAQTPIAPGVRPRTGDQPRLHDEPAPPRDE